ncbi:hypothetical protein RIR_jg8369.t1 [Rhizophagus irregularis DAOM 181602=DAOM 197198]|nr:hypothetical protein RIR_jg8369.t1 [Rhizophagus irregularis DAOM 181602=DAOM 197198]
MKLQKQQVKTTYEEWCTMRPFAKTCRYVPVLTHIYISKIGDIISIDCVCAFYKFLTIKIVNSWGFTTYQVTSLSDNSTRDVGLSWNMCGPSQMEVSNSSHNPTFGEQKKIFLRIQGEELNHDIEDILVRIIYDSGGKVGFKKLQDATRIITKKVKTGNCTKKRGESKRKEILGGGSEHKECRHRRRDKGPNCV